MVAYMRLKNGRIYAHKNSVRIIRICESGVETVGGQCSICFVAFYET